jgi:hypothetical protein
MGGFFAAANPLFNTSAFFEIEFLKQTFWKSNPARSIMTKEEIVMAIRECAGKLGRNPNQRELLAMAGITGSLRNALEAGWSESPGIHRGDAEKRRGLPWIHGKPGQVDADERRFRKRPEQRSMSLTFAGPCWAKFGVATWFAVGADDPGRNAVSTPA